MRVRLLWAAGVLSLVPATVRAQDVPAAVPVQEPPAPSAAHRGGSLEFGQYPKVRQVAYRLRVETLRTGLVARERRAVHQQNVEPRPGGVDGRGGARGPAADHEDVTHRRRRPVRSCSRRKAVWASHAR